MTALEAKDKVGFVDGSINPPIDTAEFKKWKMADSMIKSWMVNSISKEISDMFVFYRSSKALWDVLAQRYGVANSPQMYHLHRYTSSMNQGIDSITTYFNKINRCWDELARLTPIPACTCGKCTCNLEKRVADLDQSMKLMQFLMGLNPIYDVIRTQIIHLTPLPSIDKAYAMSRNEGNKKKDLSKANKYCDHCKTNGHTKDTCFKIHGYLEWFKEMREKRGFKQKKQMANFTQESNGDTPASQESNQNSKGDLANMVAYLMKEVQRLGKSKTPKDEQVNFVNMHDFAAWLCELGSVLRIAFNG
ncbi:uncharacterized protein G2W53_025796 [Senna tora]|uniref:Retrotransposon gag domain-containing protein n=1 Tax=Senna tora TaxID=362788 RepID=A0A834WI91_9FABA|nr:uncharacterized protein G2W53_025796 [Senna tora]